MKVHGRRGFSLLEMVVALGASAFVIAGAVGAALAQQRAFHSSEKTRAIQSSARAAQLFLQEKLRLAGFGMDPALAFDFQFYTPARYPSFPCPAEADGCARDAVANNDEIVFYARNPNYWVANDLTTNPVGRAWRILGTAPPDSAAAVTAAGVDVWANENDTFVAGQVLVAVCPAGRYYAYMTVSATTTLHAGPGTVPLMTVDTSNPFRRQDLAAAPGSDTPRYFTASGTALESPAVAASCFASGQARLFQIDRYRFHVRPVTRGGGRYEPYLMLDMGVDTNGDGAVDAADEMVIAEGVELLQVAYVLRNGSLPTPTVGMTAGTPVAFVSGLPGSTATGQQITTVQLPPVLPLAYSAAPALTAVDNPYAAWSWYPYSLTQPFPNDSPRLTDSQANIRAVRVALVVRSSEPDLQTPTNLLLDDAFTLYNLDTIPAWIRGGALTGNGDDGYRRVQVETSVLLPNMTCRGMAYF